MWLVSLTLIPNIKHSILKMTDAVAARPPLVTLLFAQARAILLSPLTSMSTFFIPSLTKPTTPSSAAINSAKFCQNESELNFRFMRSTASPPDRPLYYSLYGTTVFRRLLRRRQVLRCVMIVFHQRNCKISRILIHHTLRGVRLLALII